MLFFPSFSHYFILVLVKWTIPAQLIYLYLELTASNFWIPVKIFGKMNTLLLMIATALIAWLAYLVGKRNSKLVLVLTDFVV